MRTRPIWLVCALLGTALALLFALSLCAGRVWTPWSAWISNGADPRWAIVFGLRLPRAILALLVGGALGLSGAALQGYTRNPLAEPGVLGVSSSAALGAVLTLHLGAASEAHWILPAAAMLGAGLGVVALMALSGVTSSIVTFILAGFIIQTVCTAGISLALNLAPNPWAVDEIVSWLMGSLADRSVEEVRIAAPGVIVGSLVLLTLGRALDALTLGEQGARSLGVSLTRTRLLLAIGVALAVGSSVAVTGVIGFVGLIVPHLLRPWLGSRPSALLLPSLLGGAVLTLAGDILVRLTPAAEEVKLSVAMAALGAPFFLWMLVAMRGRLS